MLTYFDETIPPMESIRFLNRNLKLINELKSKTHFNLEEIQNLLVIHHKLTQQGGPLTYRKFREVAHRVFDLAKDELYDKIYSRFDQHRATHVGLESWVLGLSVVLRGTMQEKIDFCWKVYDMYGTGYVTREIMFQYMKHSIIKTSAGEDSNEVVKDLVDVILKKMDIDRDGKISYTDYQTSVLKNPMLLEALGPALPPRPFILGFLTTFTPNYGKLTFGECLLKTLAMQEDLVLVGCMPECLLHQEELPRRFGSTGQGQLIDGIFPKSSSAKMCTTANTHRPKSFKTKPYLWRPSYLEKLAESKKPEQ